jgi:hypothetical protein
VALTVRVWTALGWLIQLALLLMWGGVLREPRRGERPQPG